MKAKKERSIDHNMSPQAEEITKFFTHSAYDSARLL
jgi:hypothetical protein